VRIEWDEKKSRSNRKKHGISFEIATEIFGDPFCLTVPDRTMEGDERFWTIGRLENQVILVVVHTLSDDHGEEVIRIISARKATPRERRFYEEADE
jgi:uncharacterized DUF497 family protein